MGWIYIHTNKINGKKYIGQTVQEPSNRWGNGKRYNKCTRFYNAIKKYGWDNFEHESYEMNDLLLDGMESFLIEYYHTTDSDFGYNLESGGNKNKRLSEETRKKMSDNNAKYWEGKNLSEETKKKISESEKGKKVSEETKQKMSESRKGKKAPMYGKHHSEETRAKLSEVNKGKNLSEETRVKLSKSHEKFHYMIQSPNGEMLETTNFRAFCREHGIKYGSLSSHGHTKGWTVISKEEI